MSTSRQVVLWAAVGGVLIALLKVIEYKYFVAQYPSAIYGGLLALIFTAIGIYLGLKWTRRKTPFVAEASQIAAVGLTPREHEILQLIAKGLSNREIGEALFISENTVKTHSSRLFEKIQVKRRVQAVQRARELGLIP